MDFSKIIFIFFSILCFGGAPFFVKDTKRYFLALASFLYIFSSGWIFYHYNGLMLADLSIICLLVMGIFSSHRFQWMARPIGVPMLCFVIWGLISSLSAVNPGWAAMEVTKYFRMYLLVICLVHHVQTMDDVRTVLFSMLAGYLVECFIGIYQWRYGAMGIWFLGERVSARIKWRTMGTFYVTSFYANYLVMVLPVALRLFLFYRPPKKKWMYFFGAAFLLGILTLFTTYGRAPWIGFIISAAILLSFSVFRSRFRSRVKVTIPILILFGMLFTIRYGGKILEQFGGQRIGSYEVRFPQFRIAGRIIADNSIFGVGLSNYELVTRDYMTSQELGHDLVNVYAMMVHNSYFLIAGETGVIGFLIFLWWFVSIFATGVKIIFAKVFHPFLLNLTLGIIGGMIAIVIVFTFSPDIHSYQLLYQLTLFSGLLMAQRNIINRAEQKKAKYELEQRRKNNRTLSDRTEPNQLYS